MIDNSGINHELDRKIPKSDKSKDMAKMIKRPDSLAVGGDKIGSEDKGFVAKPCNRVTWITAAVATGPYETGNKQLEDETGSRSSQDLSETAGLFERCAKSHTRRCTISSIASAIAVVIMALFGAAIDAPIVSCSSLQQDSLMGQMGGLDSLSRANMMSNLLPQRRQQHFPSSVSRQAAHLPASSMTGDGLEKLLREGLFGDSHTSGGRVRRHIALENTRSGAGAVNHDGAPSPTKASKSAATGIAFVERNPIQSSGDSPSSVAYPIDKIEPLDSALNLQQGDDPNELYLARERILNSLRDASRKYVLATVRDPVILIHKLQGLIQDIAWSMLEELKR